MKNEKSVIEEMAWIAQGKGKLCISIIVPTHRLSPERSVDPLEIEKAIQQATAFLQKKHANENIQPLIRSINELYQQIDFNHNANGIGLFVSPGFKKLVRYIFPVNKKVIIGPSFEIKDILYQAYYTSPYFVLLISKKQVNLFRATYNSLTEGRKFSESFSLQISPVFVHRNLVPLATDENDIYALGIGARMKMSKRIAIVADYHYIAKGLDKDVYKDPLSIGFDIETGGHVFQLLFTNATGMNEKSFITNTTSKWDKGSIRFGFNLSRIFTIGKRRD